MIKPRIYKCKDLAFSPRGYPWVCEIGQWFMFFFPSWQDAISGKTVDFKVWVPMNLRY